MTTGAVGIDLGTTFSAIATVNRHGVPEILPNTEGDRITPSVILFEDDESGGVRPVVGTHAQTAAMAFPDQVVEFIKRHMGTDYTFSLRGRDYTPEELSSFILQRLKQDAEVQLGHAVTQAVITVPAYFNDIQRRATLRAGEMAGLEVLKLINEPTAAAFAYGLTNAGTNMRVLVFDLGGGTFDATLVDIEDKDIQVVATDGDLRLGGKDFDDRLIQFGVDKFMEAHGVDPSKDVGSLHDMRHRAVATKHSLTRMPKRRFIHHFEHNSIHPNITREDFEGLTADLIERMRTITQGVLDEAGCGPADVDTVLLVGGSTRMPMVRNMLTEMFGKPPATDINPDEAVALGAALQAAIESAALSGHESPVDIRTHDVTSHSLGMAVYRDGQLSNSKIIRRNTRIPAEKTRDNYITTHDGQTTIDLWLVQGESEDPLQTTVLGHFEFYGIPARPAGASKLSVTFRYNANGIVEVEAMDLATGQILPHRLSGGQVSLEDLAQNRAPMQVALVVDCSGSMFGRTIRDAQAAALAFVKRVLAQPKRQVAVVAFPGGVKSTPTADLSRLEDAIDRLTPIGSTPMSDGLRDARDLLRPRAGIQRVFVVMTDGHPDDPDNTVAEIHRLRTSGARIITVGVGNQVEPDFLRSLASRPDDYHFCSESLDLEGTFINLATELSSNR